MNWGLDENPHYEGGSPRPRALEDQAEPKH
jgi:hypothetical protein